MEIVNYSGEQGSCSVDWIEVFVNNYEKALDLGFLFRQS